jgi:hypothetical protein
MSFTLDAKGRAYTSKAPGANKEYGINFAARLPEGATIDTLQVTAVGCTVGATRIAAGTVGLAWLSGGLVGQVAKVRYRVTAAGGFVEVGVIYLRIEE